MDDLDRFIADRSEDPEFRAAMTNAELALREPPAPVGERCDNLLHVGPTGVWRCTRQRDHRETACHAAGSIG
jgi:hypothetical protein